MPCTVFCGSPSRSVKARTAGCARSKASPACRPTSAMAAADTRAAASAAPLARAHEIVGITLMLDGPESAARLLAPHRAGQTTALEQVERAEVVVDAVARLRRPGRVARLHLPEGGHKPRRGLPALGHLVGRVHAAARLAQRQRLAEERLLQLEGGEHVLLERPEPFRHGVGLLPPR